MVDATIHLRVPATIKARWVRQSRDEGMRLTDWITDKVESTMERPTYIKIDARNAGDFLAYAAVVCRMEDAEYELRPPQGCRFEADQDRLVWLIKDGIRYIQRMNRAPRSKLLFGAHETIHGYPAHDEQDIFIHMHPVEA